ncbi:MAG: hypothetical protein H6R01_1371 [Burkholderiaceae bacterium]|nr:hypothetical protein [Burkholderiaceae bacterium]
MYDVRQFIRARNWCDICVRVFILRTFGAYCVLSTVLVILCWWGASSQMWRLAGFSNKISQFRSEIVSGCACSGLAWKLLQIDELRLRSGLPMLCGELA